MGQTDDLIQAMNYANSIAKVQADVFFRMTGYLAPGVVLLPMAEESSLETYKRDRDEAWSKWNANDCQVAVRLTFLVMMEKISN